MRILLSLVFLLVASMPLASSEPARALGFEIGKAKVAEVRAGMARMDGRLRDGGTSAVTAGELLIYALDARSDGIRTANFVFDEQGILVAAVLDLPKHRYDDVLKAMRAKYTLIDEQRPFVGDRSARLKSGAVEIVVTAPHLSFDMAILYATPSFQAQMKAQQRREQDAERRRDAVSF